MGNYVTGFCEPSNPLAVYLRTEAERMVAHVGGETWIAPRVYYGERGEEPLYVAWGIPEPNSSEWQSVLATVWLEEVEKLWGPSPQM